MIQLALTLLVVLTSPRVTDLGGGAVEYRRAPLARFFSGPTLDRWLPRDVTRSTSLVVDARGEAVAVVSECSIVGPFHQIHEREIVFRTGGLRLIQTEEVHGSERRLVWRELRPHGARTWTAAWGRSKA